MKIIKNEKEIVITVDCTSDDIIDAIGVLKALLKDMPVDKRPRFPKANPVEGFLAYYERHWFPRELNVEL